MIEKTGLDGVIANEIDAAYRAGVAAGGDLGPQRRRRLGEPEPLRAELSRDRPPCS